MLAIGVALAVGCRKTGGSTAKREIVAEPFRRDAKVPGIAFAAFDRDKIVTVGGTGDVIATTRLHAASIAKPVLGCAVMRAQEEGLVSLDASVSRYVGFPVQREPTVRMLLDHTASIVDLDVIGPPAPSLAEFLRSYFAMPAVYADDAGYRYSNAGAALAAYAVERASSTDYRAYVASRIFTPLAMTTASFRTDLHAVYPASDLFVSAQDLARFGRAVLRGGELDGVRMLTARSVDTMTREALGWQHRNIGGRDVVGHEGEDRSASTALFLDMAAGIGAVVLANGDAFQSGDPARIAAISALLEKLLTEAATAAVP